MSFTTQWVRKGSYWFTLRFAIQILMSSLEFVILKKSLARSYCKLLFIKFIRKKIKFMKCGYNYFFLELLWKRCKKSLFIFHIQIYEVILFNIARGFMPCWKKNKALPWKLNATFYFITLHYIYCRSVTDKPNFHSTITQELN